MPDRAEVDFEKCRTDIPIEGVPLVNSSIPSPNVASSCSVTGAGYRLHQWFVRKWLPYDLATTNWVCSRTTQTRPTHACVKSNEINATQYLPTSGTWYRYFSQMHGNMKTSTNKTSTIGDIHVKTNITWVLGFDARDILSFVFHDTMSHCLCT